MAEPNLTENRGFETKLPWWTWVAPYMLLALGNYLSLAFKVDTGIGSLYLPTAISIILINWWGPKRTLPATYLCAAAFTPLWGVSIWWHWLIFPVCETSFAAFSWLLFTKLARGKYWLPDTKHFFLFIFIGLLIPITVNMLSLQALLTYFGEQPSTLFWPHLFINWLGDFTANFGICTPVLFSFTRFLQKRNLLIHPPDYKLPKPIYQSSRLKPLAIYFCLLLLSFFVPFEKYWYLYGLGGLLIAIQFGFGEALFCNLFVFLITYIIPNYTKTFAFGTYSTVDPLLNMFIGNILLYVFVAFTGRVISDLWLAEQQLNDNLEELKQTNAELDRFVYSVSHDLSAPLRSIQGLVNISRLDPLPQAKEEYLNKIGTSVDKLDGFIKEILDYSRNNRMSVSLEKIVLTDLCQEMMEELQYVDNFKKMKFEISNLAGKTVLTDRLRLEIILKNLLSNAIKFQKKEGHENPFIRITCTAGPDSVEIAVADNGEGIQKEVMPKIFEMFFRGHVHSNGSGLGLYIAQEVADKIGATIRVASEYGKGSTFTVVLPTT